MLPLVATLTTGGYRPIEGGELFELCKIGIHLVEPVCRRLNKIATPSHMSPASIERSGLVYGVQCHFQ